MNDPYIILGVNRNDSIDVIKNKYRNLAKKYHPDNFVDLAQKRDAENKMKEINAAYDQILMEKNGGNYSDFSNSFYDIRSLIGQGKYDNAQILLDGVPMDKRNAEWYFLNGTVQYHKGWFDYAYTSFSTACQMEPNNTEYQAALNQMKYKQSGAPFKTERNNSGCGCSACDICSGLLCADCCCECMGGDLIRCC